MKRIILLIMALFPLVVSAQSYHVEKWTPPKQVIDSTTAIKLAEVQNQSGQLIYKAGRNLTWSVIWAGASAASSLMAADVAANNSSSNNNGHKSDSYMILNGTSIVCAAAALICIISAASNLKDAGKLQQKVHPIAGGISIDL